ncbi:MAG: hypothetical protein P8J27_16870 [Mariniblastus sp.]|nr:hypothetical protein [Mariniblastus sp.]
MNPSNLNPKVSDRKPAMPDVVCAPIDSKHRPAPLVTLFALPKPFGVETDLIQKNAIKSWTQLSPHVEVLLIGDEDGIAETATEFGARHSNQLEFNSHGTPLVSSAFEIAHRETNSPFLVYCNSDVILMKDFVRAIELLAAHESFEKFVAFGQRTNLKVDHPIDFENKSEIENLLSDCVTSGKLATNACKEYFIFSRELYQQIPEFAIGRGNWDNWMIHSAKQDKHAVINLSDIVTVIHQDHSYSHTSTGRRGCYVSGEEARQNQRLAGGRHLISGSYGNWRLTPTGLQREKPLFLNPSFWSDIPRFGRLMMNLMSNG